MSRARGMRGARKMRSFIKDRVAAVASEEELEAALERSGDRLLVVEFGASWSEPSKAMAQVVGSLARSEQYLGVDFARVDLEACPALGAKLAILSAPTFHLYRAGVMLARLTGAMPNKLVELLEAHRGEAPAKRGGSKLLALLAVLLSGVALLVVSNARSSKPALPVPPSPPPQEDTAAQASAEDAAPPSDAAEAARELQPPDKKQAEGPSKGARHAQ